ncbi:protein FAM205A-like [Gracilinanus agilis]|uniref:protein FAM205A-like n=1 Tax=Gracilinanus agilis TaxID=191870 RepID=UPI001CFE9C76|nr:protein FAM205A-like [Gracilinanus agilis]
MLRYIFALGDSDYDDYTIGFLFLFSIIVLWRFYYGFQKTANQSCCWRQRKVKRNSKDTEQRAWKSSQEDAKTFLELLSVLKSQAWVFKENSVRKLLCKDPTCSVCNTVALETKLLLSGEKDLVSPPALSPSSESSCLEGMTRSTFSLDQSLKPSSSTESLLSLNPVQTPLIRMGSLSPPEVPDHWTEQLQQGTKLYITNVVRPPSVASSFSPEKLKDPAVKQDAIDNGYQFPIENNKPEAFRSKDILLNTEFLQLTRHPSTTQSLSVFPVTLSFLTPEVRNLLEKHIKKRVHFQRWGLPKRVEESLKKIMPDSPLYYNTKIQGDPFILTEDSKISTAEMMNSTAAHSWSPYEAEEPDNPFLGSEIVPMALEKVELKKVSEELSNPICKNLPASSVPILNNICLLKERSPAIKNNCLQPKYSQLFWGLPSLHSESLVSTFLRHNALSPPTNDNKPSTVDRTFYFFNELSVLPLLPKTPPLSISPSSLSTTVGCSINASEEAHVNIPILSLAECEILELHLLQRQLHLLWGLSPVMQMSHQAQTLDHELCEADQVLMPHHPKMNVSVLTKELLFFPEHAKRLLELHFQKRILQHKLDQPKSIQDMQPLSSIPNQLQVPESILTKTYMKLHQNENPQLKMAPVPTPVMTFIEPETLAKAKDIVQMHIEKKCLQIKQGIFPDIVCRFRDIGCQLSAGDPSSQGTLETVHSKMGAEDLTFQESGSTAWMELSMNQQPLAPLNKTIRQPDQAVNLPQSMIEKLEMILKHKYLAFLSGLPALYYVALYRAMSPLDICQTEVPNMGKGVVKEQIDSMSDKTWAEEQSIFPMRKVSNSTISSGDTGNELWVSQKIKVSEAVPEREGDKTRPEGIDEQRGFGYLQCPYMPNKPDILIRMDSHLRKKVLEVKTGIPQKAIDSRELFKALESSLPQSDLRHIPGVVVPESSEELQETLRTVENQECSETCSSPAALDAEVPSWTYFKEQLSSELEFNLMKISDKQTQSCITSSQIPGLQASKVAQPQPQKRPSGDMADAQVLCVHMEAEPNSLGQEYWNAEPLITWDCQNKAIGSTPNKIKGSKGNQGGGDAGWRTSSLKRRSHTLKARRPAKSHINTIHRLHVGSRDHDQTADLQEFPHSFPKVEHSGALFGMPGRKETKRDDYKGSQSKLKNSFPPKRDHKHSQPSGPKNSIKMNQIAKGMQVSERTISTPQSQTPSENKFLEKIKHFLHWLSIRKKLKSQSSSNTCPWSEVASSKKDISKQGLILAKGSTNKGQKAKKNVEFKEHYYPLTNKNLLVTPKSQFHHLDCNPRAQHFWSSELYHCSSRYSDMFSQLESDSSSLLFSEENIDSPKRKSPGPTERKQTL